MRPKQFLAWVIVHACSEIWLSCFSVSEETEDVLCLLSVLFLSYPRLKKINMKFNKNHVRIILRLISTWLKLITFFVRLWTTNPLEMLTFKLNGEWTFDTYLHYQKHIHMYVDMKCHTWLIRFKSVAKSDPILNLKLPSVSVWRIYTLTNRGCMYFLF